MRQRLVFIAAFFTVLISPSKVNGQIITPQDLLKLSNMQELGVVSAQLQKQGFEYNRSEYRKPNERVDSWCFRPIESDRSVIAAFAQKTSRASGKSKMSLTLYNFHIYHEFINKLLKQKFRFKGMKIVEVDNPVKDKKDAVSYLHFTRKGRSFLTREAVGINSTKFYEIILQ